MTKVHISQSTRCPSERGQAFTESLDALRERPAKTLTTSPRMSMLTSGGASTSPAVPLPSPVQEKTLEHVMSRGPFCLSLPGWAEVAGVNAGKPTSSAASVWTGRRDRLARGRGAPGKHHYQWGAGRHNKAYQTAGILPSAEPQGSQSTCFSMSNLWWPGNSVTGKWAKEEI